MNYISLFFVETNNNVSVFFDDNKYGYIKLKIQKNDIVWTKGYGIYLETMKIRSLCRLNLKNKCNYKNNCLQIHISPYCAIKLKKIINYTNIFNNCCKYHDDLYTKYNDNITHDIIINEIKLVVPKKYIALTMFFLNKNNSSNNNMVSINNICKSHLQHKCFFCSECKYIHICRQFCDDIIEINDNNDNLLTFSSNGSFKKIIKNNNSHLNHFQNRADINVPNTDENVPAHFHLCKPGNDDSLPHEEANHHFQPIIFYPIADISSVQTIHKNPHPLLKSSTDEYNYFEKMDEYNYLEKTNKYNYFEETNKYNYFEEYIPEYFYPISSFNYPFFNSDYVHNIRHDLNMFNSFEYDLYNDFYTKNQHSYDDPHFYCDKYSHPYFNKKSYDITCNYLLYDDNYDSFNNNITNEENYQFNVVDGLCETPVSLLKESVVGDSEAPASPLDPQHSLSGLLEEQSPTKLSFSGSMETCPEIRIHVCTTPSFNGKAEDSPSNPDINSPSEPVGLHKDSQLYKNSQKKNDVTIPNQHPPTTKNIISSDFNNIKHKPVDLHETSVHTLHKCPQTLKNNIVNNNETPTLPPETMNAQKSPLGSTCICEVSKHTHHIDPQPSSLFRAKPETKFSPRTQYSISTECAEIYKFEKYKKIFGLDSTNNILFLNTLTDIVVQTQQSHLKIIQDNGYFSTNNIHPKEAPLNNYDFDEIILEQNYSFIMDDITDINDVNDVKKKNHPFFEKFNI